MHTRISATASRFVKLLRRKLFRRTLKPPVEGHVLHGRLIWHDEPLPVPDIDVEVDFRPTYEKDLRDLD